MYKSDVEILQILAKNECTSEIQSFPISKILKHTSYKYSKISNDINKLVLANFVEKGFKISRAETYYITQKGMEKLRRLYE